MSELYVDPEYEVTMDAAWEELGAPGSFFDGAERVAIVRELRAARACPLCAERKRALSPEHGERHEAVAPLSASLVDAAHRVSSDPGRLSSTWYDALLADGVLPGQVVELASLAGVVQVIDTLERALGDAPRALPEPQPGEPDRVVANGTAVDEAWVPMVSVDAAEGMTKTVYDQIQGAAGFVFNVVRSLTAVPSAWAGFMGVFAPNYHTHGPTPEGGLSRPQTELLAATVSAHNDCFY